MRRRAIGQVTKSRRECVVAQYRLAASQLNGIEKSSVETLEGVPSEKASSRNQTGAGSRRATAAFVLSMIGKEGGGLGARPMSKVGNRNFPAIVQGDCSRRGDSNAARRALVPRWLCLLIGHRGPSIGHCHWPSHHRHCPSCLHAVGQRRACYPLCSHGVRFPPRGTMTTTTGNTSGFFVPHQCPEALGKCSCRTDNASTATANKEKTTRPLTPPSL